MIKTSEDLKEYFVILGHKTFCKFKKGKIQVFIDGYKDMDLISLQHALQTMVPKGIRVNVERLGWTRKKLQRNLVIVKKTIL